MKNRILEMVRSRKESILCIANKYGARNIRLFGSVARGDAVESSDVDFLVDLDSGRSLFDLGGFLIELEEMFHMNVDVVTEKGLRGRIEQRVKKEAIPL